MSGEYRAKYSGLVVICKHFSFTGRKSPVFANVYPMFDDDLEPKKKTPVLKSLEKLSLDELAAYIEDLKAEILRTEGEIARKKAHAAAASSFFKT